MKYNVGDLVRLKDYELFLDYRYHRNEEALICGDSDNPQRPYSIKWKRDGVISRASEDNMILIGGQIVEEALSKIKDTIVEEKELGVPGCNCRGCTNARKKYWEKKNVPTITAMKWLSDLPKTTFVDEAASAKVINELYDVIMNRINLGPRWYYNNLMEKPEVKKMNYLQKMFLGADEKALLEAGYIDEELDLTEEGSAALQAIQVEVHKAKLVEMAKAAIAERKAKEK